MSTFRNQRIPGKHHSPRSCTSGGTIAFIALISGLFHAPLALHAHSSSLTHQSQSLFQSEGTHYAMPELDVAAEQFVC